MLRVDGITLSRGNTTPVLDDVSLHLEPGNIVGVCGPSGSGKTTLAHVLTGRVKPDAGSIHVDNRTCQPREIVLIPQTPRQACNPRWSLRRSIGEPARIPTGNLWRCAPGEPQLVRSAADQVGLDDAVLSRVPAGASDGQVQRAVVARGLVASPRVLVADEPTAMLDPVNAQLVAAALRRFADAGGAVVLVSHDVVLLRSAADRVLRLSGGRLHETSEPCE